MTHAALQLLFCGLAPWVMPLRQWSKLDAAWWLFTVGTAAAILVSGLDFIARGAGGAGAFTSTGSGLDPFEMAAAVYTGVWGLAMLVGSPKGWKLRPPLGALCLSWLFWIVILVIKCAIDAPHPCHRPPPPHPPHPHPPPPHPPHPCPPYSHPHQVVL